MIKYLFILSFPILAFEHSHKDFTQVLQKRVSFNKHQSYVDYAGLKSDDIQLNKYLVELAKVTKKEFKSFSQKEQLAFLINAYNAFTLKLIINHYPVDSIKDIGSFWTGPWEKEFFTLFGEEKNLDDIEHGMIRRDYKEPRIHFAVNCASIGCPSLAKEAYQATKLGEQLEASASNFLNNKDKNYVKNKTLHISKIFKWYGEDFKVKAYGGYETYIKKKLGLEGQYETKFTDYDWSLNKLR